MIRLRISWGLLFWIALPSLVAATTKYVAKHGNNANPGTMSLPWQTIQYAVTNVSSGDTILVGAGTYNENVTFPNAIHSVLLKGGHNTNDWSWSPAGHPTLLTGTGGDRIKVGSSSPATNITVAGLSLIGNQFGVHIPYSSSGKGSVTISDCIITNMGAGYGIYGEGPSDVAIFNTVIAKADIGIYHNGGAGISGTNRIFNCTFVTNRRGNIWMATSGSGTTFISNTIAFGSWRTDAEGYGVRAQNAAHPVYIGHSLVYGNTRDFDGFVTRRDGMITNQSPGFVAYGGMNYRLTEGSPCINAGVTIPSITNDLDLNSRPWGAMPLHDIGAYEAYGPSAAPAAPTGLVVAAVSAYKIVLNWVDNAENESGFKIERQDNLGGVWTPLATIGANINIYTDAVVSVGARHDYRVRAYNALGNSDYSNEAWALVPEPPPTAPTGLVAVAVSSGRIDLSWTDNAVDETGYKIERKKNSTGAWTQIAIIDSNTTVYSDTGVEPLLRYDYRVRSFSAAGDSDYSNEAGVLVPEPPPAAPANLVAIAVSSKRINVSWADMADNETGFEIQRKIGEAGEYMHIATVAGATEYMRAVVMDRPTAYFRLGETDTTNVLHDHSNAGHAPGVMYGYPIPGEPGAIVGDDDTAVRFDGQTAWGLASDTLADIAIKAAFSVEVWAKSATPKFQTTGWFAGRRCYDGFIFGPDISVDSGVTNQRISAWVIDNQGRTDAALRYTPAPTFNAAAWHHYVFAYVASNDTGILYIDGQGVMTKPNMLGQVGGQRSPEALINLVIGRDDGQAQRFGNGWLDEVAVYDYPLTAGQVTNHYLRGSGQ